MMGEKMDQQLMNQHDEATTIDIHISELRVQIRQSIDKLKFLSSETAIRYMEQDIETLEAEITDLTAKRQLEPAQTPNNFEETKIYTRYYLEHLEELLLHYDNPVLQAKYLG